jgi:hypothetical protein
MVDAWLKLVGCMRVGWGIIEFHVNHHLPLDAARSFVGIHNELRDLSIPLSISCTFTKV